MPDTTAIVIEEPRDIAVRTVGLRTPNDGEVVVRTQWSGISTGTERLLWLGTMPTFPGMGYPLVPGYETVGEVVQTTPGCDLRVGQQVFVPGSSGFTDVRGLFGGAAAELVVAGARLTPIDAAHGEESVLLALAATAHHALAAKGAAAPELIVGHGVVGRLLARISVAKGNPPPLVWERDTDRHAGAVGYDVARPEDDDRHDYQSIYDVSGDASLVDGLIGRLAPRSGGEVVLAGFYSQPISFLFAPAFMREARLRVAAEWQRDDLAAVLALLEEGRLSLDGLITHREPAARAGEAYETAFNDSRCLKMTLDWSGVQ